jgi:hypothetical protein
VPAPVKSQHHRQTELEFWNDEERPSSDVGKLDGMMLILSTVLHMIQINLRDLGTTSKVQPAGDVVGRGELLKGWWPRLSTVRCVARS